MKISVRTNTIAFAWCNRVKLGSVPCCHGNAGVGARTRRGPSVLAGRRRWGDCRDSQGRRSVVRWSQRRSNGGVESPWWLSESQRAELELVGAVMEQMSRESLPWVKDLLLPVIGVEDMVQDVGGDKNPEELVDDDGKFVVVNGMRIHYKEAMPPRGAVGANENGHGSGAVGTDRFPCILLIHGFNASLFSWRATMEEVALKTGSRVLAFDRPPFGISERPLTWGPGEKVEYNPYEIQGSASIALGMLVALGIESVVAVGHSAGALVAHEMYVQRPDIVAALGFVAPALPSKPEYSFQRSVTFGSQLRIVLSRAILAFDGPGRRYVRRNILKRREQILSEGLGYIPHASTSKSYSSRSSNDEDLDMDDGMVTEDVVMQEAIDGYLLPLEAKDWDTAALLNLRHFSIPMQADYSHVKVPVLVLLGKDDPLTASGRGLVELLNDQSDAEVECVELDCGHIPMEEDPESFNELLSKFYSKIVT